MSTQSTSVATVPNRPTALERFNDPVQRRRLLNEIFSAAAKGDTGKVAMLLVEFSQAFLNYDYEEINADIEFYGRLESAYDSLSARIQSLVKDGKNKDIPELASGNNSPMRVFLETAIEHCRLKNIPVPDAVHKLLRGEKISIKEAEAVHDWMTKIKTDVIPSDKTLQVLQGKLGSLRGQEAQNRNILRDIVDKMLPSFQ